MFSEVISHNVKMFFLMQKSVSSGHCCDFYRAEGSSVLREGLFTKVCFYFSLVLEDFRTFCFPLPDTFRT